MDTGITPTLSISDIATLYKLPERTLRDRLKRVMKLPDETSKLRYRENHTKKCVMYKVDEWFVTNLLFPVTRGRRPAGTPLKAARRVEKKAKAPEGLKVPCDIGGIKFTIEFEASQARKFADFIRRIGEA